MKKNFEKFGLAQLFRKVFLDKIAEKGFGKDELETLQK